MTLGSNRTFGWPCRPGRAAGSRSDKKLRHAGSIAILTFQSPAAKCTSPFGIVTTWRGFLSLRDPAGAAHAAGPPGTLRCRAQLAGTLKTFVVLAVLIFGALPSSLHAAGTETVRRAHDLQLTLDSRWAGGASGGYYPLRIGLKNLARPRVFDFVFSDGGGAGSKLPTVTRQVHIDQNASLQFSLSIPLVSSGAYGQLRVIENGRELDELTQHVSLPEVLQGGFDRPSLLVISQSPAAVDCAKFEAAVQSLVTSGPSGMSGYRGYGSTARQNDFQVIGPQLLPESWIDYSALDIVAIQWMALEKIPPAARSALLKWTSTGGTLLIYDVGRSAESSADLARLLDVASQPPQLRKWQAASADLHRPIALVDESVFGGMPPGRPVRIAAGAPGSEAEAEMKANVAGNQAVWPVAPETFSRLDLLAGQVFAFPGNPFPGAPVDWAWWIASAKLPQLKWTVRNGTSSRQQHPDFPAFLIPGVGAVPLLAFVVLISIFAVLIGPVNYFIVWRRKQLYLLVLTIPTIAFLTSAALFGYSICSDGFGVQSRLRSFTMLDQYSKMAVSWNRISLYAGMTPSGGLKFSPDTAVLPTWRDASSFESGTVDWTNSQHWTRGWLRSQTAAQFETIALRAERGRIDVKPAGRGEVEVANGLAWEIAVLMVIDDARQIYTGRNLPAGATLKLAEASREDLAAMSDALTADQLKPPPGSEMAGSGPFGRTHYRHWTAMYGEMQLPLSFSTSQLESGLKLLAVPAQGSTKENFTPRTYVAIVRENPGIELGVENTKASPGLHVIMGYY